MTDYYTLAEAGLIALLKDQLADPYYPNANNAKSPQVTASDDTILNNGNNYYAIAYPGNFPVTETSSTFMQYDWEIQLDVLSRWPKTTADAWAKFRPYRDAVIQLINHTKQGRNLGNTNFVRNAFIQAEERPRYIPLNPEDPRSVMTHIAQLCIVTVRMIVPRV